MSLLQTPNAILYYDIFEPDFTQDPFDSQLVPLHDIHPTTLPPQVLNTQNECKEVLLIHGFAGTPESDFAGQLPSLRSKYRVLAPHLHGYGRSSQRQSYTTAYYREDVADLVALLDAVSTGPVLVLGFSDGGIVGLLLAALHPQRVKALAVLGAQPTINAQNVAAIRHWLLETPLSEEWQTQLARLHGEPYWRSLPAMYVQAQEALVAADGVLITDEELASICCPTLVMHGARDRVVPADYSRSIALLIPGSQLLLFDAGHAAHLRCEREYTAAVMQFFEQAES